MNATSTLPPPTGSQAETPPHDPIRRRGGPRARVLIGMGIVTVGIVAGVVVLDSFLNETQHTTTHFTDRVAVLDVDMSVGSLRVVGTADDTVSVDVTTHGGITKGSHSELLVGDHLRLHSDCGLDLISPTCKVDYLVHVPQGLAIVAHGDGTDVDVTGTSGDVRLSLNGGSADLRFSSPPHSVRTNLNGGSVTMSLPDDGRGYRVDADSDGGSTDVDIRTDPTSNRLIAAHASGGSIKVRYADPNS